MLEVFFGAVLALAVRDVFYEIVGRYRQYKFHKDWETWEQLAEDWAADDDDIK